MLAFGQREHGAATQTNDRAFVCAARTLLRTPLSGHVQGVLSPQQRVFYIFLNKQSGPSATARGEQLFVVVETVRPQNGARVQAIQRVQTGNLHVAVYVDCPSRFRTRITVHVIRIIKSRPPSFVPASAHIYRVTTVASQVRAVAERLLLLLQRGQRQRRAEARLPAAVPR